jgi:hypothetical protein
MIQVNLLLPIAGKKPDSFAVLDLMRLPFGILSGMGFTGADRSLPPTRPATFRISNPMLTTVPSSADHRGVRAIRRVRLPHHPFS